MSKFREVYNFKDPDAKGRLCVLIFTVVEGFLTYITTGIFYTEFLQTYGIDINGAGILSFIPYIASMFVLFTPELLNRFPKRRWMLGICKFLFYFINLVGLTLLPLLIEGNSARLIGMGILSFLASLFNVIATAGYAAWHIRFQPEEVRAYHLSVSQFATAMVAGVLMLSAGWLCDHLPDWFIITLRYFAFALGVVDVIFLMLPREVEYPVIRAPKFSDIISIPLKNKKFMMTMVIVFLWQFSLYCYSSQLNFYLLNDIGVTQTFYNIIIFAYGPFFIFFMKFWRKRIEKTSWFKVFAISLSIVAPLQIVYGFVQPGSFTVASLALTVPLYIPLMLLVRLPQHFGGVGHNVAFANFQYINMPLTNRDCYTSFYQIVFNLGGLAGMGFGIVFTMLTKDISFTAFGYTYKTGTPLLTMLCGVVQFIIIAYILIFRKQLEPDTSVERA
ncbi:MAG: MFS transporter [Clostridia bacterium]|nr:MFS transporter [Clostridia bacterium]